MGGLKLAKFDIIIENGFIVDGKGNKGFYGDIGIIDDKIVKIGDLKGNEAERIIDATGKVVSPGFIDTHSHSSMLVFEDPFLTPKIRQGITTELIAQDGIGPAPVDDENLSLGPNVAYLVPHGNLRMVSMGLENRKPTDEEMKRMKENLAKGIDEGAFGMSTGLIYSPCMYAEIEEFIELGKVLHEKDALFVTHQRSEADYILESMEEILSIGKESGCKIHFSHFKVCGKNNWNKIPEVFAKLDKAKEEGIIVSFDQYPYVAGSTMMSIILPPWVHGGGTEKLLERLMDEELRKKMKEDIEKGIKGWDNFVEFAGLDGIFVTFVGSEKNKDIVGKNLIEIGKIRDRDPLDAIFDVIFEEKNMVGLVDFYGKEEHVKLIMNRPEHNVCTDGIMGEKPHPRLYGAFPRVLGKYTRDEKVFPIETAIYKMTGRPAEILGLKDRGILKEGLAADIVIFDFETIEDRGDYTNPKQYPIGIEYVMVNGKILIDEGNPKPRKAGKVLKRGKN